MKALARVEVDGRSRQIKAASGRATSIRTTAECDRRQDQAGELGRRGEQAEGEEHRDLAQPHQSAIEPAERQPLADALLPAMRPATSTSEEPLPPNP